MINPDEENLKLLHIFHYVVGGLTALFGCIPLIYVALGLMFVTHSSAFNMPKNQEMPPAAFGWIFVVIGAIFFVMGQSLAACMFVTGRFIARRKHHTFIFVVSCVECLFIPFGTILGVFTIITLSRDSVKAIFNGTVPAPTTIPGA